MMLICNANLLMLFMEMTGDSGKAAIASTDCPISPSRTTHDRTPVTFKFERNGYNVKHSLFLPIEDWNTEVDLVVPTLMVENQLPDYLFHGLYIYS